MYKNLNVSEYIMQDLEVLILNFLELIENGG